MIANRMKMALPLGALTVAILILVGATAAQAAVPPVKLVPSSHLGTGVDTTTGGNVCTVESKDLCEPGKEGSGPGGFNFPESAAVDEDPTSPEYGDVYVADRGNHRVQALAPSGDFVLMFGKEVNETKDHAPGATEAEENVCTAASGDVCKAGGESAAAGQFGYPQSVTVDPTSGDVYIAEEVIVRQGGNNIGGQRVQKFTATGQFVLEFGREVNETTKGNLCTQEEVEKAGVKCTGPAQAIPGSTEDGAIDFAVSGEDGDLLAVGGASEHLLYVAGENRIQEFDSEGQWQGEIPVNGSVTEIAVDSKTSDVYAVEDNSNVVDRYGPHGEEIGHFEVSSSEHRGVRTNGLALDSEGHLAVAAEAVGGKSFGALYEADTGHRITEFTSTFPGGNGFTVEDRDLTFDANGEMYAVLTETDNVIGGTISVIPDEVVRYIPVPVAELTTGPATCVTGAEHETSVVLDCSLNAEVNPEGVSGTEAWFAWGRSEALGEQTPKQKVEEAKRVDAVIEGRPNETFYYQLTGNDQSVQLPEQLTGDRVSFTTPAVPPEILGKPNVSFVTSSSTVMFGELNPENASTEYYFEYAPASSACPGATLVSCPGGGVTAIGRSGLYGRAGATLEARGLQPNTAYRYRLVASNAGGTSAPGAEGTFTTGPEPVPQATTGAPSAIGATTATVSGTVNPDGQPATYTFELGVYAGAATQYGIVLSGSAGAGSVPVAEGQGLSGLQPGTEYAYRIAVASGYGTATGETVLFTTEGVPAVLVSPPTLALLTVPGISFPKPVAVPVSRKQSKGKSKRSKRGTSKKVHSHKRKPARGKK
ncbi:MAG TPA: hypothetical protein VGL57_15495 [Solirubrobacteraceae bacterium]|jgi:hypothetical protein